MSIFADKTPVTVDSVVSSLNQMVTDLLTVREEQFKVIDVQDAIIDKAKDMKRNAETESLRAETIADKLTSLIT